MKVFLILLAATLLIQAQPKMEHRIVHTADDLIEISLTVQNHDEITASQVFYKSAPEDAWMSLDSVITKSTVNAVLPHSATLYYYELTLPNEEKVRHPEAEALRVPSNLKKEKRKVSAASGKPDEKWVYKTVNGRELFMDVFLPEGYAESDTPFPVILIYHGGSWQVGETSWHYPDCAYWASRSMVAVSVDYRLGKRDGIKEVPLECMKDAAASVRYVREHADRLKINPDLLVVAGGSAGGQLAAALGSIITPETNHADDDLSVSAIPNAAILWNPYFKCNYDPAKYVKENLPPTISFLGDKDPAITTEEILSYHQSLKSHGNTSEYYIGHGGKHGLCNGRNQQNPYFYWSVEKIDAFLVNHGFIKGAPPLSLPPKVKALKAPSDYTEHK